MSNNNLTIYSTKIIVELIGDILYFPLWWYQRGVRQLMVLLSNFLSNKQKSLALWIWIKNIHRPMYHQYDWAGIIISFFVRLFQIVIRGLIMLFWLMVSLLVIGFWLILPLLVFYEIIFQLFL